MCPVCKVLDCKERALLLRRLIARALKISMQAIYDMNFITFWEFSLSVVLARCIDNLTIRNSKAIEHFDRQAVKS